MKHEIRVVNYPGSLDELAREIGSTRYDVVVSFLQYLGDDLMRQAESDRAKGRVILANKLELTAQEIYQARDQMNSAWNICKKHMK